MDDVYQQKWQRRRVYQRRLSPVDTEATINRADSEANLKDALNKLDNEGKPLRNIETIDCINHLRRTNRLHLALQLSEWMESSKIMISNGDRAIRIDLLAHTKGTNSAKKYFVSLQESEKTSKTYGALLRCYCSRKMFKKVMKLFEKTRELNFASTLNYNNVISLYLTIGQPEKVPALVQVEQRNIAADLYTYNQLMSSYASVKDIESVEDVLEKMEKHQVKINWFTYGNLAWIYISILGVNRSWELLKSVFPTPSKVSYLIMLLVLSKLGDLETLDKRFIEWESGYGFHDVRISNVMIESYLNRDMIEKQGFEPNLRTFGAFTNFYIKNSQICLALKYLEMGASKVNPRKKMFLAYFENNNDPVRVEKFCEIMKKINRLDSTVFDSLQCKNSAASEVE
ncbi:unnamed protein product [Withania somnifera]